MSQRTREIQDIHNAVAVAAWIEHLAAHSDIAIDLNLICHINHLILEKTERNHWAGRIRSEVDWHQPREWSRLRAIVATEETRGLVVIDEHSGEIMVQFPPDREVGLLMDALLQWLHSRPVAQFHPVVRAAIFHQRFTAIHPFRDGNGRTARALTTLLLWRENFPVEILALQAVLDERRNDYIDALRAADRGKVNEWVHFFANAVQQGLRISSKRKIDP